MDAKRFDALSRSLSTGSSRRSVLLGALGSALIALPVVRGDLGRAAPRGPVTRNFIATPMTGAKEVAPNVGDPGAKGSAQFSITGSQICAIFRFTTNKPFQITGTHIHKGVAGMNGNIVVNFGAAPNGKSICKTCPSVACGDAKILSKIKANPAAFYASIHTGDHPGGAVRGQLREVT